MAFSNARSKSQVDNVFVFSLSQLNFFWSTAKGNLLRRFLCTSCGVGGLGSRLSVSIFNWAKDLDLFFAWGRLFGFAEGFHLGGFMAEPPLTAWDETTFRTFELKDQFMNGQQTGLVFSHT